MKRAYLVVFLLIGCSALVSGCYSSAEYLKNATPGSSFYNFNGIRYWKDNITMHASGVNSTWNMTIYVKNDTLDGKPARYMQVITEGNGMNITYDIWSNATTYEVLKMHAKGTIGDYFQDRDTSKLQIYTLPDIGLSYYFVPFWPIKSIMARMADGSIIPITVYSASDNKGFSVTYWVSPQVPVPIKVEMAEKNFKITEMLLEYG
ncbi:hypothetical protein [Methanocella conradii]|uniref:hypothetical protein n=1 Tax=Methanocella conradii TaxID=1175444 RepID=UPI0024B3C357|nr:hypothetical protein [Methanocella conradii]MDI6896461.1 hypothetical protein [Methanocella conradii]